MIDRGLVVDDENTVKHYLCKIGYYRLSGYWLPFQKGGSGDDRHKFERPVNFNVILDIYVFDRKLRLLLLDAFELIEVYLRTSLSNHIGPQATPHWYQNPKLFECEEDHAKIVGKIKTDIRHTANNDKKKGERTPPVQHYYDKY